MPTTDRPLLWDVVTDEIFLNAMVGVTRNVNASGICTTCCAVPFPLRFEQQIDFLAAQLESEDHVEQIDFLAAQLESEDHVHLSEYGTITSIAAQDFDLCRVIPLWQVTPLLFVCMFRDKN